MWSYQIQIFTSAETMTFKVIYQRCLYFQRLPQPVAIKIKSSYT